MAAPAGAKPYAAGALSAGPGTFRGLSLRETAGAVATVRLWDNPSAAAGTILATVALLANASVLEAIADGVQFTTGLFAETVAGAVEGSVYLG